MEKENQMRLFFITFLIVLFSGCALNMPSNEMIVELSHSQLECSKEDVTVVHRRNTLTSRDWELSCNDKRYFCEMHANNSVNCNGK
jgi:hypothetical protein